MDREVLKHYGVVGMKWGVRKDRYIRKGTKYNRMTGRENEPVDNRVKWVSKGRHDQKIYDKMASQVHGTYYHDTYQTKKRLRKAGADVALETWLTTTQKGNLKVKDVLASVDRDDDHPITRCVTRGRDYVLSSKYGDKRLRELSNVNDIAFRMLVSDMAYSPKIRAYNLEGSSKEKEYFDTLRKKGYDAVVDLTDLTYNAKTSTIILNPKDSLEKRSSKKKK